MSQALPASPPGPSSSRTDWVDVAKALCIILVVMMHSTLGLQHAVEAQGFLDPVTTYFAPFRIPAFFVLSGLFMERALNRDVGVFLRTRVLHFAYFYCLWLAIHVAVRAGGQLLSAPHDIAATFLFALVEPYPALWFLHLLALFSIAAWMLRSASRLVVLTAAVTLYLARGETDLALIDEFTGRAVFFAVGWIFAPQFFALAKRARARPLLSVGAIAAFALANMVAVSNAGSELRPFAGLLLGLAGAAAVVALSALLAAMPRLGPAMAALGGRTLEIYVAFTLPMAAARSALLAFGFVGGSWFGIGLGSLVISAVALAAPLALARAVRGTKLQFLFRRPALFWPTIAEPPRLTPAAEARFRRYAMSPPVVGLNR